MRLTTAILALLSLFLAQPARAETPAAQTKKQLQQYVQDALSQAMNEIQATPQARKLFSDEQATDSQAFVMNYRGSGESTDVQIDKEKLRQDLRFDGHLYAGSTGGMSPRLCVHVRALSGCTGCRKLVTPLEELISQRFGRRGFAPAHGPELAGESELSGDSAFDDYSARAAEAHCDGVAYAELAPERSADADDEGEEIRVSLTTYLGLRDLGGHKVRARALGAADVSRSETENDGARAEAAVAAGRSFADLFAQAAERTRSAQPVVAAQDVEEHYVKLSGVTSFTSYSRFKQTATSGVPGLRLEERIISPGSIDFVVSQETNLAELSRQLASLNWGGLTLSILGQTASELSVVLK